MAPHQHPTRRARNTTNRWLVIVIIVVLGLATTFVVVVTCMICQRKRARRQRERKIPAEHESRALVAPNSDTTKAYPFVVEPYKAHEDPVADSDRNELAAGRESPIELQGGVTEETRISPQQLDGYTVPATMAYDGKPVEMPAPASRR
jgi:hypothetical protein